MKTTKYFIIAAAALALGSCSSDDESANGGNKPVALQVTAGISTRATGSAWEDGDAIGISTTSTGKTQYANMKYVTTDGSEKSLGDFDHDGGTASGIFMQDADEVTFAAYYPFSGNENTDAGVISNINTSDQTNQKAFDFLFASGAKASKEQPVLKFTGEHAFKHAMTRLVINIQTSADHGFEAEDVANGNYTLSGMRHGGTFNTATGEAKVNTEDAVANNWMLTTTANTENTLLTSSMILYPQTADKLTFKATIDSNTYSCEITPALEAGTSYTYTITVKKTGLQVTGCTIADWTTGTGGNGDATM